MLSQFLRFSSVQMGLAELGSSLQVDRNHRVHLGRWTSVFPSGLLHCLPKGVFLVPSESSFFQVAFCQFFLDTTRVL